MDLESGQTFVIAGMLDKQITEAFNKIPGLGDIPILGKLFQSKTITKNNSELMIIITPEIVRPIPAQQPVPELKWTVPFMSDNSPLPDASAGDGCDRTGADSSAVADDAAGTIAAAAEVGDVGADQHAVAVGVPAAPWRRKSSGRRSGSGPAPAAGGQGGNAPAPAAGGGAGGGNAN